MELMLVVWGVGIVSKLPCLLFLIIVAIAFSYVVGVMWADSEYAAERAKRFSYVKEKLLRWKTCIVLAIIITILPSESTMKYMAGAYLVQTVYQHEFTGKVVTLSQKAIINQLEVWAKDNPDMQPLLQELENK